MDMSSSSSPYRIARKDLKMKPYKITVEPLLNDEHKAQRKKFAHWARKKFQKEDTMRQWRIYHIGEPAVATPLRIKERVTNILIQVMVEG